MEAYKNQGPVDCSSDFDENKVKGKSVIVTGGNGLVYPINISSVSYLQQVPMA